MEKITILTLQHNWFKSILSKMAGLYLGLVSYLYVATLLYYFSAKMCKTIQHWHIIDIICTCKLVATENVPIYLKPKLHGQDL